MMFQTRRPEISLVLPAYNEQDNIGSVLADSIASLGGLGSSWVFNVLGKFWLGFPFHDLNVGLRMFDRKFLEKAAIVHAMNMANPELYTRARQAKLVLDEVPIQHFARTKGKTSHNLVKFVQ